jgi:hypothetical protein
MMFLKMSQYIATTNQDMLWNMFQKIPEVAQFSISKKQDIFRNSISYFYQQMNPTAHLSREQLQELNKQTISYLLDQVRPRVPLPQQTYTQQQPPPVPQMVETPEEKTQRIFEEKQKQYDDLTRKPELPKPSDLFQDPYKTWTSLFLNTKNSEAVKSQRTNPFPCQMHQRIQIQMQMQPK